MSYRQCSSLRTSHVGTCRKSRSRGRMNCAYRLFLSSSRTIRASVYFTVLFVMPFEVTKCYGFGISSSARVNTYQLFCLWVEVVTGQIVANRAAKSLFQHGRNAPTHGPPTLHLTCNTCHHVGLFAVIEFAYDQLCADISY
jgi:hypothetical protein